MICKEFISRIYLFLLFILTGVSCLSCMERYPGSQKVFAPLYDKEDLKLIELAFLKTIDMISDSKDISNQSKRVIDLSTVPQDFRVFYDSDGEIASITPKHYLKRIMDYSKCSSCCYIIALMYISKFISRYMVYMREFRLMCFDQFTFHRLYLAALVVATKVYGYDPYCTNEYYAKVGGIPTEELNALERQFLSLMGFGDIKDFTLSIFKQDFDKFVIGLKNEEESLKNKYPNFFEDIKFD